MALALVVPTSYCEIWKINVKVMISFFPSADFQNNTIKKWN